GSNGQRVAYSFTGQWAPRVGVTVDPLGKGKTKVSYNFARYFEYLPLDLAERSLSTEKDFTGARFAPVFSAGTGALAGQRVVTLNQFGTVTPVVDPQHLLSSNQNGCIFDPVSGSPITVGQNPNCGLASAIAISAQDPSNPIFPGTKLGFAQEHVIGFEQQLPH